VNTLPIRFTFEEFGCSERVVYLFAGEESGNTSAHEFVVRGMLAQPDILGGPPAEATASGS